jgi:uncharacterized protein (TIGR03435 family)
MRPFQILSRIPLDRAKFDVIATIGKGTTQDEFRIMMRNLLAERFFLKVHLESRELPAWEMTVAKSGAKLKQSQSRPDAPELSQAPKWGPDGFPVLPAGQRGFAGNGTFVDGFPVVYQSYQHEPISSLISQIQYQADLPIVDRTGLVGEFDFRVAYCIQVRGLPSPPAQMLAPVPYLFGALREQLGLVLTGKKLPFDVALVDSVNLVPQEN